VAGTPPVCQSSGACTTGQCDAALGCVEVPVANGTACTDGDACTNGDSCQAGLCAPTGVLSCSDPGPCRTGYCDPVLGCSSNPLADGSVCSDGDPNTFDDMCQAGVCLGGAPPPDCVADADCLDADLCNGDETCVAGSCVAGTPPVCQSSGACTTGQCDAALGCVEAPVANGTACNDDDACTNGDSCQAGVCAPGSALTCDDPGPCRTGYCDPMLGCASDPLADGTMCSDGDPDTVADTCQAGVCMGSEPEPIPGAPPGSTSSGTAAGTARLQSGGFGLRDTVRAASPEGDPRLFVVQRDGRIYVAEAGSVMKDRAFLDLRDDVSDSGDGGLLGLAFDPGYASNGYFYVYRTTPSGHAVLSRFEVSADAYVANPLSELEILRIALPTPGYNPGGGLVFGPDGYLFVGVGDGDTLGDPGDRAQDGGQLLGKILRLNVSNPPAAGYRIPGDNPFVGSGGVRDEIWALGLRNPSHLIVDDMTGDLWITDQGQGQHLEINFETGNDAGGHNYGWDVMEGTACNMDRPATNVSCGSGVLTDPLFEYDLMSGYCEIVGGFVYRGALPDLFGQFFFADACAGVAWSYDRVDDAIANRSQQYDELVSRNVHVVGFGQDGLGEGYVFTSDGRLYKMRGAQPECSDGVDNDRDGLVDSGADPGCENAESTLENPRCDDQLDNDGDGTMDGADLGCRTLAANAEAELEVLRTLTEQSLCGLGAELVLILPPLIWLRGRRRRARWG
jgi:glucose/arabinose dehydrogenase